MGAVMKRFGLTGKRFGDLQVMDYVRGPDFFVCLCDCGERVVKRISVMARQEKAGADINCGICNPPTPKKRESRSHKSTTAKDQEEIDQVPPCEKMGGCARRALCKDQSLACLDFYRYVQGKPYGIGGEPMACLFRMSFEA